MLQVPFQLAWSFSEECGERADGRGAREEDTGRQAAPVENQSADIEAGSTSQGTSALEAEGKVEIKNQAVQRAEDKAICEKRAVSRLHKG